MEPAVNDYMKLHTNDVIKIARMSAQIILENGGETYRAEETVNRICKAFGCNEVDILAIPTGVFISMSIDGINYSTSIKRIRRRSVNLTKIDLANDVARKIVNGSLSVDKANEILYALLNSIDSNNFKMLIAAALSSGSFVLLLKGSIFDCIIAVLCGSIIQFVSNLIKREDMFSFFISLFGGVIISGIAVSSVIIFKMGSMDKIIAGAITPLLPGLAMTNAIRDTMRGDLVSGVARAAESLLVAIALATGVGVILKLYYG